MSASGKVVVTKSKLDELANAINEKAQSPGPKTIAQLTQTVNDMKTGGGITPGAPGDITFYDYDGTIVTSWTLAELATKTALPDYPSHEGLICQGWNWSLADLKTTNRKMNVGAMYITDDGKTRIYIRLEEGRTSPALAVCPNGTVTVDWGDGTTPNTLTGTSITNLRVTPNHSYATPGEYVIKLTVDGAMGICGEAGSNAGSAILRYSIFSDARNYVYRNSVQKIEFGSGVSSIGAYAFEYCASLESIAIPNSVPRIEDSAFNSCYSLASATIPNSVTSIGNNAFSYCYSAAFYDFSNHTSVPTLANTNAFNDIPADCQIRVPASLVNEWEAATNWSTYAGRIVGV